MKQGIVYWFLVNVCLSTVSLAEPSYFSKTDLFIHADVNRQPLDAGIWTLTFEHASEWRYGDNFLFLDIEGKPDYKTEADLMYFEYAPRFSLDRIFNTELLSPSWLGELYATLQYNDGDKDFINRVWLYGLSFDFAGQANHGFSNLHFLLREEATQDLGWQVTLSWGQPFKIGSLGLRFQGFTDVWENDSGTVLLTEPQLLLPLKQFVGDNHWLAKAAFGTEIEITNDFFGADYGWEVNPTLFFDMEF